MKKEAASEKRGAWREATAVQLRLDERTLKADQKEENEEERKAREARTAVGAEKRSQSRKTAQLNMDRKFIRENDHTYGKMACFELVGEWDSDRKAVVIVGIVVVRIDCEPAAEAMA